MKMKCHCCLVNPAETVNDYVKGLAVKYPRGVCLKCDDLLKKDEAQTKSDKDQK